MNTPRTAQVLEYIRWLAISRVQEGATPQEVAEFLDVAERSVWRWMASWREFGPAGLASKPGRGRPAKLTARQAQQVLSWLDRSPSEFGFCTERWTAPRLTGLMRQLLGVQFNHRYVNDWLARHGITPQIPQLQPRERDQDLIDAWVGQQWPRIKKTRGG